MALVEPPRHRLCRIVTDSSDVLVRAAAAAICTAFFLLCGSAPLHADTVESFYKGRTVQFVVGYTAGGAYDLYARVLARHLAKHLPGRPMFVLQNMPGAGSLKAANYLYGVAPQDGSAIGMIGRGLAMEPLLGEARYDSRKFAWLGSITRETSVCATWVTAPVKRLADMFTQELTVGGEGSGSDPDVFALMLRNVFGARIKLVSGYPGGAEINLAMERGEVHGRCGWSWSSIKSTKAAWLKDGRLNLLLQFALQKESALADIPSVLEVAKTEEQTEILKLVLGRQSMARPVLAPPGTPGERKQALRSAFDATMEDPDFIADAAKADLEISPVAGAEIDRLLAELYRTPKDVIDKASRAIK
jgi:tripartite-type tricarboxylate transporter receptor subunit TctC